MKKSMVIVCCMLAIFSCEDSDPSVDRGNVTTLNEVVVSVEGVEDLDTLIKAIGDSRFVLLGEASHGTSEFYQWRAEISQRLIEEQGFNLIAVEGDWPDLYKLNEYIHGQRNGSSAADVLSGITRWPTWMWANDEVATFAEWLRTHNTSNTRQVSFYGLDVYSLWPSLQAVHDYLQSADPNAAQAAAEAMTCFQEYFGGDEFIYGQDKASGNVNCAEQLQQVLAAGQQIAQSKNDEAAFNAVQNAMIAVNAERYYSSAVQSSSASWNIRDQHMMSTVDRLLAHHGDDSKIIIWAHNTHVGDARATDMASEGMVNIGQLVREQHEDEGVYIVGFGTYSGTVVASHQWGAATQSMQVPAAQPGSWEAMLHEESAADKIVFLDALKDNDNFDKRIGHRAIGVVYNPEFEQGNYVPSILPERYDAFIFIDQTEALHPIGVPFGRINNKLNDSKLMRVND